MIIIQRLEDIHLYAKPVLTLGNFDGLHRGHRAILERVLERARQIEGTGMVFTFQSHPLEILAPQKSPPRLTTLDEKIALLRTLGIQVLVSVPFTPELARQSAEKFLQETIYQTIHPSEIIVGHDYAFGYRRQGTVSLLGKMQSEYGYKLEVLAAVQFGGVISSSTQIRKELAKGEVGAANKLLGRIYSISAPVVAGSRKGKGLGFPTANLEQQPKLMPAVGVYAVWVSLKGRIFKGVANIGYQPTYGRHPLRLEVHIIDFEGDIYKEQLRVGFVARLRDEVAFAGEAELKAQIEKDLRRARQILTKMPPPVML